MVTYAVRPPEVRALAGRLRDLKEAFERFDDTVEDRFSPAITGDDRVSAALRELQADWYDRRAAMASRMEQLAGLATDAAQEYEESERERARGVGSG